MVKNIDEIFTDSFEHLISSFSKILSIIAGQKKLSIAWDILFLSTFPFFEEDFNPYLQIVQTI